jgi:enoyl-CoA hydratase/carnithine racemase
MIHARTADGILRLVIDRPAKKNALSPAMYDALTQAFVKAADDKAVRVIAIEGQPGIFCAGNDIATFEAAAGGDLAPIAAFLRALANNPLPLIAAIDGPAVGIGTTLLFHCDSVIATERSYLLTPFVDLGLVPEAASSLIGPALIGHHRAFSLLALGEKMSARAAEAAGLIHSVVEPEELAAALSQRAAFIASKPPAALRASRALIKGEPAAILARMEAEIAIFRQRLASPEAQAAFRAFLSRGSS